MCGIAGIVSLTSTLIPQQRLQKMADALQHRGPDGEGFWINEKQTVGFAHRRLTILDHSKNADQPLHYLHYTIIFNGEIYNYFELKNELRKHGYSFATQTDTEVIPAAFDFWGTNCLHHFDGMFAFALFNKTTDELFIGRDRMGEKPLYYYTEFEAQKLKQFLFASEMKALWNAGVSKDSDGTMVLNYLTLGYVQNPQNKAQTFYKNISSLQPAHYIIIKPEAKLEIKEWYKTEVNPSKIKNEAAIAEEFKKLFFESVTKRLRSDVPVGTSLSGGIDSSSIVAAIHQQKNLSSSHWKNAGFTAIFSGFEKDESRFAKLIAEQFHLLQYTVSPAVNDWIKYFDILMYYQEEPLQSSSVLVQFLVYKLARQNGIIVLLDGQGADEILGGYKKYSHWYLQHLFRNNFSEFTKEKKLLHQNNFLEQWGWKNFAAAFFPKQAAVQLQKKSVIIQQENTYINKDFIHHYFDGKSLQKPVIKSLEDILYYNSFNFGLEELLRYADRNSMAHSTEVRLPFLNHQLIEFIFSLPSSFKIKDGFTKWILRKSMQPFLPNEIVWRKNKIGYEPPQKSWMQNKQVQEMIIESKHKLVKEKVLNKKVLQNSINPKAAHDADNFDWRFLCASNIF